ncbi:MAG: phage integrase N-terminal SAM-like domain-containing protein [Anaerolineae bacterium]|nr:phage integrase N-terminal SAM-like domain-containing protein [Anaerolineae bacterium]
MSKSGLPETCKTRQPKKLLDKEHDAIQCKHDAYRTEKTYTYWAKRFILCHNKRHRLEKRISGFLTTLAGEENAAASARNQALGTLRFLCREVLRTDQDLPIGLVWPSGPGACPQF